MPGRNSRHETDKSIVVVIVQWLATYAARRIGEIGSFETAFAS